jgi:periplasmic protein TonB
MKAPTLLSSWENPQDVSRANLVYESRNKMYGGYFIRVHYPERIFRAFVFAVFGVALVSGALVLSTQLFETVTITIPDNIARWVDPPPVTPPVPPVKPRIHPPGRRPPSTLNYTPVAKDTVDETNDKDKQTTDVNPKPDDDTAMDTTSATENTGKTTGLPPPPPEKPETVVDVWPIFKGGEEALFKFLRDNINYPAKAREINKEGRVYVTFVVSETGKIRDVRLLKGVGYGLDEETIRVVKLMPDWTPGMLNGKKVSVQYNLPVNFSLR